MSVVDDGRDQLPEAYPWLYPSLKTVSRGDLNANPEEDDVTILDDIIFAFNS